MFICENIFSSSHFRGMAKLQKKRMNRIEGEATNNIVLTKTLFCYNPGHVRCWSFWVTNFCFSFRSYFTIVKVKVNSVLYKSFAQAWTVMLMELSLVAICIPDTWIPDSSEYRTLWVSGIQMVKSSDLADHYYRKEINHLTIQLKRTTSNMYFLTNKNFDWTWAWTSDTKLGIILMFCLSHFRPHSHSI